MNISLTNKRALVCGSTQGIGWATAQALAKQGAEVVLFARNESKLQDCLEQLKQLSDLNHDYLVADFNHAGQVTQTLKTYLQQNDGFHILINNSGGPPGGPITSAELRDFTTALQRHLYCNHVLVQSLQEFMAKENYGRIINIVSTSVYEPIPGLGVSNTTRGAVASWAKTMSMELASKGITVNNVLPGATWTERLKSIIEKKAEKTSKSFEEVKEAMLEGIPSGRFAQAEETADAISFLSSPAAAYITGVSLPVDGGRMHKI